MTDAMRLAVKAMDFVREIGTVTQFFGLVIESDGPNVFLGERCEIYIKTQAKPIPAEVVGIKNGRVLLMAYGDMTGIQLGSEVVGTGKAAQVAVGEALLGRVIDGFGEPLDGLPLTNINEHYPHYANPMNPLNRPRISEKLETGIRAIDTFLTLGKGQRIGIFSGSGVGKSTLLGMLARNTKAHVNVIALIGERGREVLEFIEQSLGGEGLARSVVIVATSDQPALVRSHAVFAATAIAEYFRDQGRDVLLTMDSITRYAMAQREIGLAIGEPPTARGYTPSVFAMLPRLLERGGTSVNGGSITALYTVLVEGDDVNDPIADSIRSILDGHIVLTRELAQQGHFPAIDILQSNSRLINQLIGESQQTLVQKGLKAMSDYMNAKDMIDIGAYQHGSNQDIDEAIKRVPELKHFLTQQLHERISEDTNITTMQKLFGEN
ncbi:MAG: FliI/YscN family ATPase [Gammaproteobacteria bacterium]|nr:FliI/YscN family ATPase [Gammaproteobacteria bacterium]